MPVTTYHIRIKKNYAAAILKDLRIREVKKNPGKAVSWEEAQKKIKQLAK
jgi:hypothetical protein